MGEVGDADGFFGADVEGLHGGGAEEDGPEPDGEVGGVEVGAEGCAVAGDGDGLIVEGIADEVADGEVGVEGEVRADEGEAAGDLDFDGELARALGAHLFCGSLALGVDVEGVEWVRGVVIFRDVGDVGRLRAVDGSGAGEEEFLCVVGRGELESAIGAVEDGGEHLLRVFGELDCAGFGGGVDDEREVAGGELEVADIPGEESDGGIGGEMRTFAGEGAGRTGEDGGVGVEIESAVDVGEGFDQPAAEEAGAAGDEEVLVAHLVPEGGGVFEDVIEVFGRMERRRRAWLLGKIAEDFGGGGFVEVGSHEVEGVGFHGAGGGDAAADLWEVGLFGVDFYEECGGAGGVEGFEEGGVCSKPGRSSCMGIE